MIHPSPPALPHSTHLISKNSNRWCGFEDTIPLFCGIAWMCLQPFPMRPGGKHCQPHKGFQNAGLPVSVGRAVSQVAIAFCWPLLFRTVMHAATQHMYSARSMSINSSFLLWCCLEHAHRDSTRYLPPPPPAVQFLTPLLPPLPGCCELVHSQSTPMRLIQEAVARGGAA